MVDSILFSTPFYDDSNLVALAAGRHLVSDWPGKNGAVIHVTTGANIKVHRFWLLASREKAKAFCLFELHLHSSTRFRNLICA